MKKELHLRGDVIMDRIIAGFSFSWHFLRKTRFTLR